MANFRHDDGIIELYPILQRSAATFHLCWKKWKTFSGPAYEYDVENYESSFELYHTVSMTDNLDTLRRPSFVK